MKNKINLSFDISIFEPVSENSESKLIGGFSQSHSSSSVGFDFQASNNCEGGNCASNCGDGPIGQNNGCNVAPGCGAIIKK